MMKCLLRFGGMTFCSQFAPFSHSPPCMTLLAHDSLGDALCSVRVLVISSQVLFILHPIADPRSNLFIPLQGSRWHEQGWLLGANLHLFHPCMTLLAEPWAALCGTRVLNHAPHPINFLLYLLIHLEYTYSRIVMSVYRMSVHCHICILSCLHFVMSVLCTPLLTSSHTFYGPNLH